MVITHFVRVSVVMMLGWMMLAGPVAAQEPKPVANEKETRVIAVSYADAQELIVLCEELMDDTFVQLALQIAAFGDGNVEIGSAYRVIN